MTTATTSDIDVDTTKSSEAKESCSKRISKCNPAKRQRLISKIEGRDYKKDMDNILMGYMSNIIY